MAALITGGRGSEIVGATVFFDRLGAFSRVLSWSVFGLLLAIQFECAQGIEPFAENMLNRRARMETAIQSIPLDRLDRNASEAIRDVLNNPSFFRQMPQKTVDCDPQLLTFMVRHPEVMVNIWELVGITNITASRTGPNTFFADDGAGTKCNCELVYSDDSMHIYYGTGNYDGMLVPRTIKGRVVCVLRSQTNANESGHCGYCVQSNMDVFVKVDNLGADLLTRTLAPLVGRVTEHNFEETSKFVGQFSEFCAAYPKAVQNLAGHLNIRDDSIRQEFVAITARIGGLQEKGQYSQTLPGRQREDTRVVPVEVASDELRESLGHIQLATLPDLMGSSELEMRPDTYRSGRNDFGAESLDRNPGWVPMRDQMPDHQEFSQQRLHPSSGPMPDGHIHTRSSTIMPRRPGVQLRR